MLRIVFMLQERLPTPHRPPHRRVPSTKYQLFRGWIRVQKRKFSDRCLLVLFSFRQTKTTRVPMFLPHLCIWWLSHIDYTWRERWEARKRYISLGAHDWELGFPDVLIHPPNHPNDKGISPFNREQRAIDNGSRSWFSWITEWDIGPDAGDLATCSSDQEHSW